MTAQLKLIIDKCYCRGSQIKGKKIGVIVPGVSPVDAVQYELISSMKKMRLGGSFKNDRTHGRMSVTPL